jgi:hypothetical protein
VILVRHPGGHVAVAQAEHAAMCGELACAWGNGRFGSVEPEAEVRLAAEQHELGWVDWDRAPTLDPATGLPFSVRDLDPEVHLPMQLEGPRRLASQSPYAGLLALLKHRSMYQPPRALALLRPDGRRVRSYLQQSHSLGEDLRAQVAAGDEEIERNWRLVRAWDGLSHDLLLERAPCTRPDVPDAAGELTDLRLERRDGALTVDPWPFADDRVRLAVRGRLLHETFDDQERMRAALAGAPEVELVYDLVPA